MEKFIGLEHGKKKMKTSIKIDRLEKKIAWMVLDLELLKSDRIAEVENSAVQTNAPEQYIDSTQSEAPVIYEQDGGEFVDHDVTRGALLADDGHHWRRKSDNVPGGEFD